MAENANDINNHEDMQSVLDQFRESWEREIQEERYLTSANPQAQAEVLYSKAVELEQQGQVYDALPYYRRAFQLDADIEFKYYESQNNKNVGDATKPKSVTVDPSKQTNIGNQDNNNCSTVNLLEKFQQDLEEDASYNGKKILKGGDPKAISTGTHISDLPPEMITNIFCWVVSSQLDMKSLEVCANVCKGFYISAKDDRIWHLACNKVWGPNVGELGDKNENESEKPLYLSWREMYIFRERLQFHGCYISKASYVRLGENSFQDQNYRPVQVVQYYRYIRFLPDGRVMVMNNSDEPHIGVHKLKTFQNTKPEIFIGNYRLCGPTVTLYIQSCNATRNVNSQYYKNYKSGAVPNEDAINATTYNMELQIASVRTRKFVKLIWISYSIHFTKQDSVSVTKLDVSPKKFPPLWFSPVPSYNAVEPDGPLA